MNERRAKAERRGRRGENLAAWYLRLKGWRILARRVKTPRGEVDLVARRWGTVCFVEVKWRASARDWASAIDEQRLRRVAQAAQAIAPRYTRDRDLQRIDVLLLAPRRFPRHIVNAWMP
ncbi:MAG: YraN family protein [Novosphingobium sp.]|nr:YraN family protein [Novosphingobium sp.]